MEKEKELVNLLAQINSQSFKTDWEVKKISNQINRLIREQIKISEIWLFC